MTEINEIFAYDFTSTFYVLGSFAFLIVFAGVALSVALGEPKASGLRAIDGQREHGARQTVLPSWR
jgi:hypothetical protein